METEEEWKWGRKGEVMGGEGGGEPQLVCKINEKKFKKSMFTLIVISLTYMFLKIQLWILVLEFGCCYFSF